MYGSYDGELVGEVGRNVGSPPRSALSAISSAVGVFLGVFGIAILFLFGGFPGGDKMAVFTFRVTPDLEDHRTEATATPPYRAKLFRIVVLLVHKIDLIENLFRLLQTDPVLPLDVPALLISSSPRL
jgi:hypothetical protein